MDDQSIRTGHGRVRRRQDEVRVKQTAFLDLPGDAQLVRWIEADARLDIVRRLVGDAAMQREDVLSRPTLAIGVFVQAGRTVPGEAATAQPFVEAGEPADTTAVGRMDETGMDRAVQRRFQPSGRPR